MSIWMPDFITALPGSIQEGARNTCLKLLRTRTVSASQVIGQGVRLETEGLLCLTDPNGTPQYAAFQFDAAGQIVPIVQEINILLGTGSFTATLAAWQWWYTPNMWRTGGALPVDLLGQIPDSELMELAKAVTSEM